VNLVLVRDIKGVMGDRLEDFSCLSHPSVTIFEAEVKLMPSCRAGVAAARPRCDYPSSAGRYPSSQFQGVQVRAVHSRGTGSRAGDRCRTRRCRRRRGMILHLLLIAHQCPAAELCRYAA